MTSISLYIHFKADLPFLNHVNVLSNFFLGKKYVKEMVYPLWALGGQLVQGHVPLPPPRLLVLRACVPNTAGNRVLCVRTQCCVAKRWWPSESCKAPLVSFQESKRESKRVNQVFWPYSLPLLHILSC